MSPSSSQATGIFGALADPTRFGILQRLRSGELRVAELCRDTGCAQSLISFHLKGLREAGLVRSRKEGRSIWYSIDPAGLSTLVRLVETLGGSPDEGTAAAVRDADLELCLKYINHR